MNPRDAIQRAKALLIAELGDADWLTSVGIARIHSHFALRLSVRSGCRAQAERALADLHLGVPVEVREVGPARVR